MNDIHAVTSIFGLNKTESEVFEYLLEYGNVKAAELRQLLHLDRAPFYRAVNDLVLKDLIVVEGTLRNQSLSLQDMAAIQDKLKVKKQQVSDAEKSLTTLQASMRELRDNRYRLENIEVFSGQDAYIRALRSVLAGGGKILRDLNPGHPGLHELAGSKKKYDEIVKEIKQERIKKRIAIRILMDNQAQGLDTIQTPPKAELKEYRVFPSNLHMKCYLNVCGSRCLFYTHDVTGSWGIVLKDQFVARLLESLYDVLWNQAKPL